MWICITNHGNSWWRHQMETVSALLAICAGNSPVTGEFPTQRPVTRRFDVFFDLRLNKWLSKQWWGWWFETPWGSLWRHCNVFPSLFCSVEPTSTPSPMPALVRVMAWCCQAASHYPNQCWHKYVNNLLISWWRHDMITFSSLVIHCEGNQPITGGFPSQKGQYGTSMFSLLLALTSCWINSRVSGDLGRYDANFSLMFSG